MRFEQDFIMRQIQYLTQVLQQVIFKKNQNEYQEVIEEIEDAFQRLTKDHPKELHELNLNETLDLFMRSDKFESELALAAADLLKEKGEILRKESFSKSQKCYQQALLLYKKALNDNTAAVPLDIREKISHLENQFADSDQLEKINRLLTG